jgi:hypothetical protein
MRSCQTFWRAIPAWEALSHSERRFVQMLRVVALEILEPPSMSGTLETAALGSPAARRGHPIDYAASDPEVTAACIQLMHARPHGGTPPEVYEDSPARAALWIERKRDRRSAAAGTPQAGPFFEFGVDDNNHFIGL